MAKKPIIPYGRQWIDENDIREVVKVLKSDWLTQGTKIEEFEKAVAKYCGAKYGVAVCSGTVALHTAYSVAGIGPGDEVITTPLTFAASANMAAVLGVKLVFVDIESDTLNINPELVEGSITSKTKAIVAVDFAGHPCDYDKILKIAKKHKLLVIEDACHALGAKYASTSSSRVKWKRVGSLSDMTIFSFHPVKHITTGEGGMILTNNKDFYEKFKTFRHHGVVKNPEKGKWYYEIDNLGFNYRITDFQCALGLSQLKKINKFLKRRKDIASKYNRGFRDVKEIILPAEKDYAKSAWHIYPIQLKKMDRRKVFEALQKKGIGAQVHYMPLHLHPFYKNKFGYKKGDFPLAEKYYKRAISLPLFPKMTNKDIQYVINSIKKTI